MKEIALSSKRIKAARIISKGCWRARLRQASEAVFVITENGFRPFAFYSANLALFLADSKLDIVEISLINQRTQVGSNIRDGKLLQLGLEDDTAVYLYSSDELRMAPKPSPPPLNSPNKISSMSHSATALKPTNNNKNTMKNNKTLTSKYKSSKRPEQPSPIVIKMMDEIEQEPDLNSQARLFVLDQKLNETNVRWMAPGMALSKPWLLWKEKDDKRRKLIIHSTATSRILVLCSTDGVHWERDESVTYEDASNVIPKPYQFTSWMERKATERQLAIIEKMTKRQASELPVLCSQSITSVIQTKTLASKRRNIEHIVDAWEQEIYSAHGAQTNLFAEVAC